MYDQLVQLDPSDDVLRRPELVDAYAEAAQHEWALCKDGGEMFERIDHNHDGEVTKACFIEDLRTIHTQLEEGCVEDGNNWLGGMLPLLHRHCLDAAALATEKAQWEAQMDAYMDGCEPLQPTSISSSIPPDGALATVET